MSDLPGGEAPLIDGVLDEAIWEHAARIDDLRQVEPVEGAPPSQATEVFLIFDTENLYVGLRCHDDDPASIRATQMARDADLGPDDRVEMLFDPFLDRRNAFWFQIGAGGSRGDALITKNGSFNKRWDGVWFGRSKISSTGWTAEARIPLATLNFDPEGTSWGFNVRRRIRRNDEDSRWAGVSQRVSFFSVADAGILDGFEGLHQGLGLDLKPFVVGDFSHRDLVDRTDFEADGGLDLFYRISPSSKLSLSINTDFAETEVDERQVNLTRFRLFFPEKRDFFLEDSGVFNFGPSGGRGRSNDVVPFFSRRIGLDSTEGEIPIQVATKWTGGSGDFSYGLMGVRTGADGALNDESLFVGRFSQNVLGGSDVGVIWTHGDPAAGRPEADRNNTYGADFNYRTSSFLGDRNLEVSTYALKAPSDAAEDDYAYHASVRYPNDTVDISAEYMVVENDFDPALGFVRRTGSKKYKVEGAWRPRPGTNVRQYDSRLRATLYTDSGNDTESVELLLRPLGFEWESGERWRFDVTHAREVLDSIFEISSGVNIPTGAYGFTRYGTNFETSDKRDVSVELEAFAGDFYEGHREDYGIELDWRVNPHLILAAEYTLTDVRIPWGDFRVHVARARCNVQFGPELLWTNFFQWDSVSDELGLNSRVWWILRDGTELFFVVNQGWRWDADTFSPGDSQVTAKFGYTFRL